MVNQLAVPCCVLELDSFRQERSLISPSHFRIVDEVSLSLLASKIFVLPCFQFLLNECFVAGRLAQASSITGLSVLLSGLH